VRQRGIRNQRADEFVVSLDSLRARIEQASHTDWAAGDSTPEGSSAEPADEISTRLAEFDRRERLLSKRRRELHERIDFLEAITVPLKPDAIAQLSAFKRSERSCSFERRQLHHEIDGLRAQARE